jgi:hypothetical protein
VPRGLQVPRACVCACVHARVRTSLLQRDGSEGLAYKEVVLRKYFPERCGR